VKTAPRLALSLAISALLLWVLVRWGGLSLAELGATVRRLSPATFAAALAVHCLIYVLRAWRFCLLVPGAPPPSFAQSFAVGAVHNLAVYLMPAKTGEAAWVLLLKSRCGVPAALGLASLLVARLLDMAVLCGTLGAACLALQFWRGHAHQVWLAPLGAALLAGAAVLGWASGSSGRIAGALRALLGGLGMSRTRLGARVDAKLAALEAALREAGRGRLLAAALLTLPQWLAIFAFYAILARGLGLPESIGFAEAAFGSSLTVLSNLLPINGFAGLGTQEGGWVLGFGALGVSADLALSTGLGVHAVQLVDTLLLGAVGHAALVLARPRPSSDAVQ
jgi:uncharacterized protein (TIRG00374 family)